MGSISCLIRILESLNLDLIAITVTSLESDESSSSCSHLLCSSDHPHGCASFQQTHCMKEMTGAAVQSTALASSCRATAKLLRTLSSHGHPVSHAPVKQIFYLTAVCPPHGV